MTVSNIYSDIPDDFTHEVFEEILRKGSLKLERIISKGHKTPKDQWYDQDQDEWVILLKGSAGLVIDGEREIVFLKPGDYVLLPAHLKHRVEWTDPEEETIWLAVHYQIQSIL
jgi:cupin 2 domain-containing protein